MPPKKSTKKTSTSNEKEKPVTEKEEHDYLLPDPEISDQKFVLISFLKTNSLYKGIDDDISESGKKENKKKKTEIDEKIKGITVSGIKIRGCYATKEEAEKRAKMLQSCDPYFNIYIGDMGHWLPFDDNTEKAKTTEYENQELNKLMKTYVQQQEDAKEYHQIRTSQMKQNAISEAVKKSIDNKDVTDSKKDTNDDDSKSIKKEQLDVLTEKERQELINEKKKKMIEDENARKETIDTLRKLEDELQEKLAELKKQEK